MKQKISDFINWSTTQNWDTSSFFPRLHSWFTEKTADLSKSDYLLISSKYLLTRQHAVSLGITKTAQELWNELILSTSCWNEIYKISDETRLSALLCELKEELKNEPAPTKTEYAIENNFSSFEGICSGRTELFKQVHEWLTSQTVPLFLYGIAGIGKSTLAKTYATKYASFYDTILYATYETNLLDLIISDRQMPVCGLSFQSQGKRGEKGRYFRKKIKIIEKLVTPRTLLIVDNFDTMKDAHLSDILSLPCKIIFTTRTSPHVFGAHGMQIEALPDKEALRQLFFLYAPTLSYSDKDVAELDKLIGSVQGHTLTIKLIAAHLEKESLSPEHLSLDSTDISGQLSQLFRLAKLTKEERTVLRYLSIMPLSGITLTRFAKYCHFTKISVINHLIHRNMIEFDSASERIFLHPLIAQTIRNIERPGFSNCWPYASTICNLGRQTWWNTSEEMDEYRKYFFTFMEYINIPEKKRMDDIIYLVDGCWQLGNFTLAENYGLLLHKYCLVHYGEEHLLTARIRHSMGTVYYNWGKIKKASYWYTLGYSGYRNASNPDIYFYGILLMKAGRAMRNEKKWTQSEDYLKKAIAFLQKHLEDNSNLPTDKPPKESWLILLFDIYCEYILLCLDQNKSHNAWDWCMKYRQQYDQLQFRHESMLWKPYYAMGLTKAQMNQNPEAEHYLNQALMYAEKYHSKQPVINLMILEALEKLLKERDKKKEIRVKIRKLKNTS